jgi:hypothetical protein
MSLRFLGSLLAFLVPGLVFAQATITITPAVGANTQTVFNSTECVDGFAEEEPLYTVKIDFGVATPGLGSTFTVKMGETCSDATNCLTIVNEEDLTLAVTNREISLSPEAIIDIIGETDCASTGGNGIDQQFKLFVEVEDGLGVSLGKKETPDAESLFIDTIKPLAPLNPVASGGENVLNVSWETNPDNDGFELEQENSFRLECKLTGAPDADFADCGAAGAGTFRATVDDVGGITLENGVSVDVRIFTADLAGNESEPTAVIAGVPQDVLDFGENFNGSEQGGCAVGHGEGQILWIGFLIGVILLLRKNRDEVAV